MTERLNHLHSIDPDDNIFNSIFPDSDCQNSCKYYSLENFNKTEVNPFFNLSLFNCNIRSFNSNGPSYAALFESLSIKPNFIVLTETWNSADTYSMCNFHGYTSVHTYRECARGGGVSVFYDSEFNGEKLDELSICSITIETCVCRVYFDGGYFVILGVYRPHSDSVLNFTLALESILNNPILKNASMVLLAGDMNVNISDDQCILTENYLSLMHSFNFLPVITRPTRFSNNILHNTFSNLDHIWINKLNPVMSGILCIDISDHCPTFIFFHYNKKLINNKKRITIRPYSDAKFNLLKSELNNTNWDRFFSNDNENINELCEHFVSNLNENYCKYFPAKVKYVSEKRLSKPWLTPQLKKLINKKSQYFKLLKMGKISNVTNNIIKNEVNSSVRRAKNNYYIQAFTKAQKDMKKSWNLIRNLLGSEIKKQDVKKLIVDGCEFTEAPDIANQFNNFFCSVAHDLESRLPTASQSHMNYLGRPKPNHFYLFDLTVTECSLVISKLKITHSDTNTMPVKIFKNLSTVIVPPLCKLINFSFSMGKFPDMLKIARITPIFKKGDRTNPCHYRPIASLPYISKIFERCMANKLLSFLNKFSILHPFQFGFQKYKSTFDALLNLTEFIYKGLNEKKQL